MAIALPVLLLVLFAYLFGGAMDSDNFGVSYVSYVFMGALAVAICQGATAQATAVCSDIQKGILDRIISLPTSRASFIVAHVLTASIRTVIALVLLFAVGFIMGFRPTANFAQWLGGVVIILGFVFAMSWLGVLFGLLSKSVESSAGIPAVAQILVFLSSAFVPTATMVAAFRYFASYQPVTTIIDTLRYLFLGLGEARTLEACLWILGLIALGFILSLLVFKKRIKR
jgi:ABC-2 type transport system permease protein